MRVGHQQKVDFSGIEAEGIGILFVEFPASLKHAAINCDPASLDLDYMARARNATVRAVKRELHA